MEIEREGFARLVGRLTRDCAEGKPTPHTLGIREVDIHTWAQPSYEPYFSSRFAPPEGRALRRVSGRALDAGCGPGRHLLHLQCRGIDAVGIDFSAEVCRIARERGARDVRQMSLCAPQLEGEQFDTLLLLGDTLGYAVDEPLAPHSVLRELWRYLRPGGLLIGHVARTRVDIGPGIWHTGVQFLFLEYAGEEAAVPFMIFSLGEWRDVLYRAGFNLVDSWGDGGHGAYLVAERMAQMPPEAKEEVSEDIAGEINLAHFEGRSATHALNVDGWKWWYQDAREWFDLNLPPAEREALSHARGRVLDVGCGVGRHVLYCQKAGLDALGIDISPLSVKVARARGARAELMDVFQMTLPRGSFDTVLLMGNNIGMVGGPEPTLRMLRILREMARDDGLLICGFVPCLVCPGDSEGLRWVESQIRIEFKGRVGPWFRWAVYHPETVAELCRRAGWEPIRMIEGDALHHYAVAKAR